jgi:hypothetical protein
MYGAETDCEMCYSGVIVCWCVGVVWCVGIMEGYCVVVMCVGVLVCWCDVVCWDSGRIWTVGADMLFGWDGG